MKKIIGVTVGTPINPSVIVNKAKTDMEKYVDEKVGDIDEALDAIIAIQNKLIGGDGK